MSYSDIVSLNQEALASFKIQNMAKLAIQDEDGQIELVEIVNVGREKVQCGVYYHLTLKVKIQRGRRQVIKIIKKVVWKGRLMEVIGFSEPSSTILLEENNPIIPLLNVTPMLPLDEKALNSGKIVKAAKLSAEIYEGVLKDALYPVKVVDAESGTVKFAKAVGKLYALTLYVTKFQSRSYKKMIKTWVWDRKWLETLKEPNYSSYVVKGDSIDPEQKRVKQTSSTTPLINVPPHQKPRKQLSIRRCGGPHNFTKKERHGSEAECVARLVLNNHNFKNDEELEFVEVVKGTRQLVAGYLFDLTIMVNDRGTNKIFEATAWTRAWMNFWKLTLKFISSVKAPSKLIKDGIPSGSRKRKAIL